jgi:putative ABC transport system permease protein
MIKNYLLITLRSLLKNKVFIMINILGMAIAIASCIVGFYNYDFNNTFDEHHVNASKIYRVSAEREFQNKLTQYGIAPIPLGEVIRQNVGDAEKITRYNPSGTSVRIGDEVFGTNFSYVDADFFSMFSFELKEGNFLGPKDKTRVLISETLATKYFGNQSAIGKTITQIVSENELKEFVIGGVYRIQPTNSSFGDEAFALYDNYLDTEPDLKNGTNWYFRTTLFISVNNPSRVSAIESQLKPFVENNNKVREDFIIRSFKLDPLSGMALRDRITERQGTWTRNASPIAAVVGTGIMGILILLISCFNLTNTSVAVSSRRLKEIGIRKVMGSQRAQLIAQFMGETMLICFMALLTGMVIAEFLLIPAFNNLWPYMKLTTNYTGKPDFLFLMIGVLLFTAIIAGSYPALYISRFQPISILKGKLKFGGTNYFTRILLMLQYAISLIAIVCSFAFIGNARYQRDFDLGFDQKGVVYTYIKDGNEFETYRNALVENPNIISIAGSTHHIFSNIYNDPIKHEGKEIEVDIMNVGDNYLKTVGLDLVEGRDFQKDSETDFKESVIITEKLARSFAWDKPIGKEIVWMDSLKFYVVGVIKDAYTVGLWRQTDPLMLRYTPQSKYAHIIVSTQAKNIVEVNQFMEKKWKEVFPNRAYYSRYMDAEMVEANTVNNNIVKMFVFLGIVAMMLSATGLFTLVSLNIIKRMKEIGVRKVLGASVANIARVINMEFAIILLISTVLGCYAGAFLSEMLMDSIWDFHQSATFFTFAASAIILFAISGLTIGFKIYNTATMNPTKTLRDE